MKNLMNDELKRTEEIISYVIAHFDELPISSQLQCALGYFQYAERLLPYYIQLKKQRGEINAGPNNK